MSGGEVELRRDSAGRSCLAVGFDALHPYHLEEERHGKKAFVTDPEDSSDRLDKTSVLHPIMSY